MTFIDSTAKLTVSILDRGGGGQNTTTGQAIDSVVTIQSGVVADIQPLIERDSKVFRSQTGNEIRAQFVMYTETMLTGDINIYNNVLDAANNLEYQIVGIDNLRDHWEFNLMRIDRDGV